MNNLNDEMQCLLVLIRAMLDDVGETMTLGEWLDPQIRAMWAEVETLVKP